MRVALVGERWNQLVLDLKELYNFGRPLVMANFRY